MFALCRSLSRGVREVGARSLWLIFPVRRRFLRERCSRRCCSCGVFLQRAGKLQMGRLEMEIYFIVHTRISRMVRANMLDRFDEPQNAHKTAHKHISDILHVAAHMARPA